MNQQDMQIVEALVWKVVGIVVLAHATMTFVKTFAGVLAHKICNAGHHRATP